MGYKSSYSTTEKLALTNPMYWVEIRTCLSREDLGRAEKLLSRATVDLRGNGTVDPDIVGYRNLMIGMSLVSWNLDDDETGLVIPIDPCSAATLLSGPDFDVVWSRVNQLNSAPEGDDAVRFPDQRLGGD